MLYSRSKPASCRHPSGEVRRQRLFEHFARAFERHREASEVESRPSHATQNRRGDRLAIDEREKVVEVFGGARQQGTRGGLREENAVRFADGESDLEADV